ncbi:hypothetical protein ACCS96_46750, partial [Rhizobium ruizarguesonis]
MRHPGTAVVTHEVKPLVSKRFHQSELIGCHGAEAVIGQISAILIEDTPNERGYARFGRAM